MPATVFKTEAEFISALIWRLIVTGLLAGALGMLCSNGNVGASALFGAGISLLTLVGLQDRHVLRFDVHRSKHGWLRTMMLNPAPFGFKLPLTALAALFLLTWVSGSSKYALGLVYLAVLIGVGQTLGHALRRRFKK